MNETKSICNQIEWILAHELGCEPAVHINVWNMNAHIMIVQDGVYTDITDILPKGETMAIQAIEKAGGAINCSGQYPPTNRILKWIEKEKYGKAIVYRVHQEVEESRKKKKEQATERWNSLSNTIYTAIREAGYRNVALAIYESAKKDSGNQAMYDLADKIPLPDTRGHTYEQYLDHCLELLHVRDWKDFPENLHPICQKMKKFMNHAPKDMTPEQAYTYIQEAKKAFFDAHPEMGQLYTHTVMGRVFTEEISTAVYRQYRNWTLWLLNIEDGEHYVLHPFDAFFRR